MCVKISISIGGQEINLNVPKNKYSVSINFDEDDKVNISMDLKQEKKAQQSINPAINKLIELRETYEKDKKVLLEALKPQTKRTQKVVAVQKAKKINKPKVIVDDSSRTLSESESDTDNDKEIAKAINAVLDFD